MGELQQLLSPDAWDVGRVKLLDHVVTMMYQGGLEPQRKTADEALKALRQQPNAWRAVDTIITHSEEPNTKFFALQILKETINTKWKVLPEQERAGIKEYIVNMTIKFSADEQLAASHRHFVTKLNETLVEVVKQEWPHSWESFIPDICASSKNNQALCENNMKILCILSEELFEFGKGKLQSAKLQQLKTQLNNQLAPVFELCSFVLGNSIGTPGSVKPSLVEATLKTLSRYLSWIPVGYIFETTLLPMLIQHFWDPYEYRLECINCMYEIASLEVPSVAQQYQAQTRGFFRMLVEKIAALPPELATAFHQLPPSQRVTGEIFLTQLALLLTAFLKHKLWAMEAEEQHMFPMLQYMAAISNVPLSPTQELFKICLEFWHIFAARVYLEAKSTQARAPLQLAITTPSGESFTVGEGMDAIPEAQAQQKIIKYDPVFTQVRKVMISKMAKPPEVTIKENEEGQLVRADEQDTEELAVYKSMRELLIYLTNLNPDNIADIMMSNLSQECLVDPNAAWAPTQLNRLSWAIGSISGAHTEQDEKKFLVNVIKDLLSLCDLKRGKENKAVVATNIMYVVGQYPRFLKAHWKFLRTVIFKLFEFMHETFPGVQEMAVDTFLKITQKCRRKFVAIQVGEQQPFVDEMGDRIGQDIAELEPLQVCTFYEAVGYMVSAAPVERQQDLCKHVLKLQTDKWNGVLVQAGANVNFLHETSILREISLILRVYERMAHAAPLGAQPAVYAIYDAMLKVYKLYSDAVSASVQQGLAGHESVKLMRKVKRDVLHLVATLIQRSSELKDEAHESNTITSSQHIAQTFVPPLLGPVLQDYRSNAPEARDAEVLHLLQVICACTSSAIAVETPKVLGIVFDCTLDMIKGDFQSYPDHRTNFYELLKAVNTHCFESLFLLPPEHLRLYVESLIWAIKHEHPNTAETGLTILSEFVGKIMRQPNPEVCINFFQTYYSSMLRDVFGVLTDTMHKAGFLLQVQLLQQLISASAKGGLEQVVTKAQVQEFLAGLICGGFPNMTRPIVEQFVVQLFTTVDSTRDFTTLVGDFLVSLREWTTLEIQQLGNAGEHAAQQAAMRAAIPGLVPQHDPSRGADDMDDL